MKIQSACLRYLKFSTDLKYIYICAAEGKQGNHLNYASVYPSRTVFQVCVDLYNSLKWTFSLEYENEHKLPFEEIFLKKMFTVDVIRC